MELLDKLKEDLKKAMKEKDVIVRDTIRSIMSSLKQIEVDLRKEITKEDILKSIKKLIKQKEDAIGFAKKANRDDLIEKNQNEINILKKYLPKQLSDQELEKKIKAIIEELKVSSLKEMGKIMKVAKEKIGELADGKRISEMVKKLLS